eukprot:COSAG06_NODE_84_length_25090_cov_20.561042_5_plen_152_part_00
MCQDRLRTDIGKAQETHKETCAFSQLLLLNGCKSVVLAGHSMGAAIGCEAARRLLAGESRSAGQIGQTQEEHTKEEEQTGQGQSTTATGTCNGGGATWRDPTQLRALCMLSGAAIHWTLGSWCARVYIIIYNLYMFHNIDLYIIIIYYYYI